MKIGFIGLGVMGMPMALKLAKAGNELVVWNRTEKDCRGLLALGAQMAGSPEAGRCRAGTGRAQRRRRYPAVRAGNNGCSKG